MVFYHCCSISGFMSSSCLDCHYYDITKCKENGGNCSSPTTKFCGDDGGPDTHSCYAVWIRMSNSSQEILQMKGCFLNNKECVGQDKCIARNYGNEGGNDSVTLYCCCTTPYCNSEFEWRPDPTTTTVKRKFVPFQVILLSINI